MAKGMGAPAALAASTSGLSALGSAATLPLSELVRLIDWPLRLSNQGMIIGFLGAPPRPMVDAMGMPMSMWVAWMSPLDSESRMAAQLAPLVTVELMPYFLKSPFSWAMTMGEQSVSAMMPKLTFGDSGDSLAVCAPTQPAGSPEARSPSAVVLVDTEMNFRRDSDGVDSMVA